MKTVLTSAQPPWQFSKKLQGIFQSIGHRQPDNTQFTHPACLWLAGWLPATKPTGHDWQRLSCKKISSFAEQNASLCDPPHPPGDNCWAFPLVPAGSPAPKLSTTTLHDGAPPHFWSTAWASLPAIAGRQAKMFWPKVDIVLKNPDIYISHQMQSNRSDQQRAKSSIYMWILFCLKYITLCFRIYWHCSLLIFPFICSLGITVT